MGYLNIHTEHHSQLENIIPNTTRFFGACEKVTILQIIFEGTKPHVDTHLLYVKTS